MIRLLFSRTHLLPSAAASNMSSMRRRPKEKIETGGGDTYGRTSQYFRLRRSNLRLFFFRRFVTLFWPKKVKASKLEEIHAKMVMKEAAPRQPADTNISKKQRTSAGLKTNGSSGSAPASASVRANGKSHR